MKVYAIVPAAGSGARMASGRDDKPFVEIAGKPILYYVLAAFERSSAVDAVTVAVKEQYVEPARVLVKQSGFGKVSSIVVGGGTRTDSVKNAMRATPAREGDIIMIHDGARPFITDDVIKAAVEAAALYGAAVAGVPCTATIKEVGPGGVIKGTPDRKTMWEAQTPQAFRFEVISKAYAENYGKDATDDSMLVERMGQEVRIIEGSRQNIKITTPEDIVAAEAIIRSWKSS